MAQFDEFVITRYQVATANTWKPLRTYTPTCPSPMWATRCLYRLVGQAGTYRLSFGGLGMMAIMDDNTGWSLLCAIAILASGILASWALTMSSQLVRGSTLLWSVLPLLAWTLAWAAYGNSNEHWRRLIALGVGILVGPISLYAISEIISYFSSPVSEHPLEVPQAFADLNYTVSINCISSTLPTTARTDRAIQMLQFIDPRADGSDPAIYSVARTSQMAEITSLSGAN